MRYLLMVAILLAAGIFVGCGKKQDPNPDLSPIPQPVTAGDPKAAQPGNGAGEIDIKSLPKEGPGDPALTYEVVKADPAKYRGKRVTWAFAPLSSEGKRVMSALNMNEAIGLRHVGIYVVEFASDQDVGGAFTVAFQEGSTVTGTVAGQVDQFLVVRDANGVPQKDTPKVTVPLLVYPSYKAGGANEGKG